MPNGRREYRQIPLEVRLRPDGVEGRVLADVLTYYRVDDYGTEFHHESALEGLQRRMPTMVWGHNWLEPIGRWTDYDSDQTRLRMVGELDLELTERGDMLVPRAHQAWSQMNSRTVEQFSIGFITLGKGKSEKPGATMITKMQIDEVSPVIVGAVPDTKLLAVRSALIKAPDGRRAFRAITTQGSRFVIYADDAQQLLIRLQDGEYDLAEALTQMKTLLVSAEDLEPEEPELEESKDEETPVETPPPDEDAPVEPTEEEIAAEAAELEAAALAKAELEADLLAALEKVGSL